jgi:hypothetical protein
MKAPKAQIAMFSELLIGKLPEIDTSWTIALPNDRGSRVSHHHWFAGLGNARCLSVAPIAGWQTNAKHRNRSTHRNHHDFQMGAAIGAIHWMVHVSLLHLFGVWLAVYASIVSERLRDRVKMVSSEPRLTAPTARGGPALRWRRAK